MFKLRITGDLGFEVWFEVENFAGYMVSTYGNFIGKYRKHKNKKVKIDKDNYEQISFWKDGKRYDFRAHRIVYETFNGNIPDGYQVNHIDENKRNNRVENLNIMTCKENINYGTGIRRRADQTKKPVNQYDINGNFIKRFDSVCEAADELNLFHQAISKICLHRPHCISTGGFKFEFAEPQ